MHKQEYLAELGKQLEEAKRNVNTFKGNEICSPYWEGRVSAYTIAIELAQQLFNLEELREEIVSIRDGLLDEAEKAASADSQDGEATRLRRTYAYIRAARRLDALGD